ncbi:MAG: hypothetical protein GC154_09275 [bacterium]|nr:hypothetical protein [bacterium]
MKRIPLITLSLFAAAALTLLAPCHSFAADNDAPEGAIRVMTFNIRYDNPKDPNPWPVRRGDVAAMIGEIHKADIAGLQEALRTQIDDLAERLPEYGWFGVGREDGKSGSEHTCIFYRKDRFHVMDHGDFWLSETPEVPGSKSWDAALTRICTWGKMHDIKTGKVFYAFNTHFDHIGEQARRESAKLILKKMEEIAGDSPVELTGDFNSHENSQAYQTMVGKLESDAPAMQDTRYISATPSTGPDSTFTNWKEVGKGGPIDYIFVKNGFETLSHHVLDNQFRDFYPSDHLPVLAVIRLKD